MIRSAVPALLATALLAVPATAAAPVKITPSGAGKVKLGATHASLHHAGLVGAIRRGCELAGPNTRSARLRSPLKGAVDYTTTSPRRVRQISVTGGGTARGVGIGSTRAAVKRAFPRVRFDSSTVGTFGIVVARVPRSGGGRLEFAIDAQTNRVTIIGIPALAFCE